MFHNTSFMKDLSIMQKALGVESLRRKVIADNLANINVPHFKRSEVNFESELRRVLDSEKQSTYEGVQTNKKHIPFNIKSDYRDVLPRIHLDYTTGYRNDGNNVDPDKELALAAKNQMRYTLFIQQIDQHFRMINGVMKPSI